jgi:hypothetical protein
MIGLAACGHMACTDKASMRHTLLRFCLLAVILAAGHGLAAGEPPFALPAAYACDLAFADGAEKGTGRMVHGGADKQRMELNVEQGHMAMILRHDLKQAHMLMLDQQMVMTLPLDQASQSMDNPLCDPKATWKKTGSETVNGVACDRYDWTSGDSTGHAFIDAAKSVPVRIVVSDDKSLDFSNYTFGPQPADLFEVPKGFKPMGMPVLPGAP